MNKENKIVLSIIVPCYNEGKNIPLVLSRFKQVIKGNNVEVIMVENGSVDGSDKILKDHLPKYSFARMVRVDKNQGYGNGILTGLKAAKGSYLGWTHADMQTDPKDVISALKIIQKSGSDQIFVKGKRQKRSFLDLFFTIGMSIFESLLLKTILWEINAQPTIFSRNFFESWKNPPKDFSLDLYAYALARRYGLKIIRIPVSYPKRIHGSSSWNSGMSSRFKLIKRTLGFSWKLRQKIDKSSSFLPEFIAHRVNTINELTTLPVYYGVEIDLRDRDGGKIIMQHDPFTEGEDFSEYLKHYHHGTMILNIKSERIEHKVLELLKKYNVANYLFLDSSFPMIDLLSREGEQNIALRYSEYEGIDTILAMKNKVKWVWVDCFTKLPIDQESFQVLKEAGFKLCLVSPELQGRPDDVNNYKKYIRSEGIIFDAICTKSYNVEKWL